MKSYLVCATPRSGSSLLCEALWNTGVAGYPDEYFRPARLDQLGTRSEGPAAFCHAIFQQGMAPNGVAGAKIMWGDLERLVQWIADKGLHTNPTVSDVAGWFSPLKYIWITRRDKVRQAVSLSKAAQTNIWRIEGDNSRSPEGEAEFRGELIDSYVRVLTRHDGCWRRFFARASIDPLILTYEELDARYEETVLRALRYIDASSSKVRVPPARLLRQADGQSEEWVRRYNQRGFRTRFVFWSRSRLRPESKI